VIVEFVVDHRAHVGILVRSRRVAGFAGEQIGLDAAHDELAFLDGGHLEAAAGHGVFACGVALGAVEVGAVGGHVHIQRAVRQALEAVELDVHVAVLDAFTAPAEEVAGAAVVARGRADVLRDGLQIDGGPGLARTLGPFHLFVGRMPGGGRELLVGAGLIVTDQAVHEVLVVEVEGLVLPAVAGMTTGAARFVAGQGDAEVVDDVFSLADGDVLLFLELLLGTRADPRPVGGFHDLFGGLGVAGETGGGDVGPAGEFLLQYGELAVVGGGLLRQDRPDFIGLGHPVGWGSGCHGQRRHDRSRAEHNGHGSQPLGGGELPHVISFHGSTPRGVVVREKRRSRSTADCNTILQTS
jgi:hypothetical protein